MNMKLVLLVALIFAAAPLLPAQSPVRTDSLPRGAWARLEVDNGDSVFVMSLRPVRVGARRNFKNFDEQRQYYLYVRAAKRVYPYALQALNLYGTIAEETADMNKRKRKRFIRHEHRELRDDFKERMKELTRTEGKVLIKMIEWQLEKPFYDVIRDTRGGMTAAYWHNLGKVWGYDLKQGYRPGADPLLDDVFLDYDFGNSWY
jgi:hypothetical protein